MAADAATVPALAPAVGPGAPALPRPDPQLVEAAGRLGGFYNTLRKRKPNPSDLDLMPGERRGGKCEAEVGVGPSHHGRSLDYAAALILTYGPYVVGAWELSGAQTVIQGWIVDQREKARWERDPSTGQGPPKHYPVDTTAFRSDFDAVIAAVDAAALGVVYSLLDALGGVLGDTRLLITPEWGAKIHREVESIRAKLLETVPSGRHMRGDPYDDVPAYRGDAARIEFGPKVAQIGDPLLSILFEQPTGVEILRTLARSPGDGVGRATSVVAAAENALREFRGGLGTDVVWRYAELRPAVLEHLGLAKVPGLADYLSAIGFRFVKKSTVERVLDAAGLALMALSLIFSGGMSAVVVAGAGVVVSGVGLGVAFLNDQERARGAQAFAFQKGEKRLIQPRFPVGTAVAAAALLLSAIGFYFSVRGLRVPTAPRVSGPGAPPRPGAPAPSVPPNASSTAPAAKSVGPGARSTDKAAKGTGSRLGATPPKPAAPKPAPSPAPQAPPAVPAPETPATSPPLPPRLRPQQPAPPPAGTRPPPATQRPASAPTAPRPTPRASEPPLEPPGAPRPGSEPPPSGKPSPQDRGTGRVPPTQRGIPPDEEQIARDAARAFERQLEEFAKNYNEAQGRIIKLLEELEKVPENAELVRRLEIACAALGDPEAYASLVVELSREVAAIRAAGLPPAAWEEVLWLTTDELRAAARLVGLTEQTKDEFMVLRKVLGDQEFFDAVSSNSAGLVDLAFTQDDHGIMTHALQDWIVTRALARQNAGTGAELRAMLAKALAPSTWPDKDGVTIGARVWAEVWDSTGARTGESGMHSPEFLTRMLMKDFPGISSPPPPSGMLTPAQ